MLGLIGMLSLAPLAQTQGLPMAVHTTTTAIGGFDQSVDIYRPLHTMSRGVAVVAHGWTRSRSRHSDLGRALADAGVTVVIPDLPNVMNLWGNGDAIVELAQQLEAGAFGLPPLERSQLVLIGTSAGGLATVLASARLAGLAGWVGLDPVDRTGTGRDAAAELSAPAIVLLAQSSHCNLFGSGRSLARALPQLHRMQVIEGASHCDFESPSNNLCRAICGGGSDQLTHRIRQQTVEATLELLAASARRTHDAEAP
ncbi:MAG: hypothetical protein ABIO63_10480 [Casimicrobiaceae bacterium]